ncbi:MAG: sulfurtransferase TusA family protein [Elusimicrobiota bacterium]
MTFINIKPDETLDCVGLYCPMPVVKAGLKLEEMQEGKILEVLADDPGAKKDFPAWCISTKNEFLGLAEEKDGVLRIFIRKKI